jgi:hypothetical protein
MAQYLLGAKCFVKRFIIRSNFVQVVGAKALHQAGSIQADEANVRTAITDDLPDCLIERVIDQHIGALKALVFSL